MEVVKDVEEWTFLIASTIEAKKRGFKTEYDFTNEFFQQNEGLPVSRATLKEPVSRATSRSRVSRRAEVIGTHTRALCNRVEIIDTYTRMLAGNEEP